MAGRQRRIETLVGLFLFVGLLLLGGLIVQYGRLGERFQADYTVTVAFRDASGLIKGSQVRLSGAKIGQVAKAPELTPGGRILVKLSIREGVPPIDANSSFQITSLSLLGDKAVAIVPPGPDDASGRFLENGDFIEGRGPGGFDLIQTEAAQIASDAAKLMGRAGTTLDKIDQALDEVRKVSGLLSQSVGTINNQLLTDQNLSHFGETLAELRGASRNIRRASEDVPPILADAKRAIDGFHRAATAAETTFSDASSELEKLGPALDKVPEAVDSIAQAADNASDALRSVKDQKGLVGTLAYDREPAQDAKTFLRNLRRYGILGYRDAQTHDERDPRNRFRGRRR